MITEFSVFLYNFSFPFNFRWKFGISSQRKYNFYKFDIRLFTRCRCEWWFAIGERQTDSADSWKRYQSKTYIWTALFAFLNCAWPTVVLLICCSFVCLATSSLCCLALCLLIFNTPWRFLTVTAYSYFDLWRFLISATLIYTFQDFPFAYLTRLISIIWMSFECLSVCLSAWSLHSVRYVFINNE